MAARPLLVVALLLFVVSHAIAQTIPSKGDVRLVIFSDFNGTYGSTHYPGAVLTAIEPILTVWKPDLLISAGDVVAGQNAALPASRFDQMWAAFDTQIAARLRAAGIPYAFAIGNHDGSSLRRADGSFVFAREREAAHRYWGQPMYRHNLAYHDRSDFPFNYSFTFQNIFFVVLDASSAHLTAGQTAWLERELSSPAATRARLRIAVGHLPLYGVSVGKNKPGEVLAGGDALRRLFERHGVHTYVSGHHAAYFLGRVGGLELLFSGGIGARSLLGSRAPPRSTVTVLDVDFEPLELRYSTFDAVTGEPVELDSLPEQVAGLNGVVPRLDLAPVVRPAAADR